MEGAVHLKREVPFLSMRAMQKALRAHHQGVRQNSLPTIKKLVCSSKKNAVGTIIQLKSPWFQINHRGMPASRKLCMYV